MSRVVSLPVISPRINAGFSVQGDILLYAGVARVPIGELTNILSRGSGSVVLKGTRPKVWFQAQCAHYGLATGGTLAALRLELECSLKSFQDRMREKAERVEKERLSPQNKSSQAVRKSVEGTIRSSPNQKRLLEPAPHATNPHTPVPRIPIQVPTPPATQTPVLPRSSYPGAISCVKPTRSGFRTKSFTRRKLSVKFLEPNSSDTDTDSESGDSLSATQQYKAFPPLGRLPSLRALEPSWARRERYVGPKLSGDVVSGRWALHVTCSTMTPVPAPWRAASSKWLRGDMNVHLSPNRRSITAEFALFGMDGIIKSRKFESRSEGVCTWVKFVAQMPVTTPEDPDELGLEQTRVFGPSAFQYGYLNFSDEGRVQGMLRCRRYGRLEFEGVRVGCPLPLVACWSDFV